MNSQPPKGRYEDYVTVAARIAQFYELYPQGRILTHIVEHDEERGFIVMRAEIYRQPDDATPASTGHAFESRDQGQAQKTSYIEVCETSCAGRALFLLGFETKKGNGHASAPQGESRITAKQLEDIRAMAKTCIEQGDTAIALKDYLLKSFGVDDAEKLTEAQAKECAKSLSARIGMLKKKK